MLCCLSQTLSLLPFRWLALGAFLSFYCEIFQPLCQSVRDGYSLRATVRSWPCFLPLSRSCTKGEAGNQQWVTSLPSELARQFAA